MEVWYFLKRAKSRTCFWSFFHRIELGYNTILEHIEKQVPKEKKNVPKIQKVPKM